MEKTGVAIIGGGVIGLAVAAEVSKTSESVYLLERHDSFGRGASSRNSEVIHAGIYYPKDSLKTRTCVEGNRLTYDILSKNNIPHKRLGKLIVAVTHSEAVQLERLYENAKANGVADIRLMPRSEVARMEPNVAAKAALYSGNTGIVDTHRFMKRYAFMAEENGAALTYAANVTSIKKRAGGYEVAVLDSSGEKFKFMSEVVINCAGLESDTVAEMAGIDIEKEDYALKYCKGRYFFLPLKKSGLITRLIYPVPHPESAGLGIHATPNMAGVVRLGPDAEYIERKEANYNVDEGVTGQFYNFASQFLPFLEKGDLTPDTAGIRAKLQGPGEPFRDFVIKEESGLGLPGFIDLIGIESPGFTASPSIARIVAGMLA